MNIKIPETDLIVYGLADAHISHNIYPNQPEIEGDACAALESLTEQILADARVPNSSKIVLLGGDNFDTRYPEPMDIRRFAVCCTKLKSAGIRIAACEGNHDKARVRMVDGTIVSGQWIELFPEIEPLNNKTIRFNGLTIAGLDYVPGHQLEEALASVPSCDILVMHQPFSHLSPWESHPAEAEGLPETIRQAVIVGHIHLYDVTVTSRNVRVVSPGATHKRRIGEKYGGCAVLCFAKGKLQSVSRLVNDWHRVIEKEQIADEAALENFFKQLSELRPSPSGTRPVQHVELNRKLHDAYEAALRANPSEGKAYLIRSFIDADTGEVEESTSAEESRAIILNNCVNEAVQKTDVTSVAPWTEAIHASCLGLIDDDVAPFEALVQKFKEERDALSKT